jgi:SagB-type dehydrogenase family enzyme
MYHYEPKSHQLVRIASGDRRRELASAALHQVWLADAPAAVVITAVLRRTSAKYGDRAERYVHIEAGHAAENVCLQAVALGLGTADVGAFADAEAKRRLGLGDEEPLLIIPVGKPG